MEAASSWCQKQDEDPPRPGPGLSELKAGMALEAYFRLPDGKQSCSPFDGECKECFASGIDVFFDFGIVQHVPWTWVAAVEGKSIVNKEQVEEALHDDARPSGEVPTTTASSGSEASQLSTDSKQGWSEGTRGRDQFDTTKNHHV
eukprot:s1484_g12.t2